MSTAVADRLVVTVEDAKAFLRVDHNDEDELIEALVDAAKATADAFLNNPFTDADGNDRPIPSPVRTWVMRRVATQYENRLEGVRSESLASLGTVDYGSRLSEGASGTDMSLLQAFRLNPGL